MFCRTPSVPFVSGANLGRVSRKGGEKEGKAGPKKRNRTQEGGQREQKERGKRTIEKRRE